MSRYHFLHSNDGELFSQMLIDMHMNFGLPSEYDLFLAQAVLQVLSLRNVVEASKLFKSYVKYHPTLVKEFKNKSKNSSNNIQLNEFNIFESSILNFTNLLILSLKKYYCLKIFFALKQLR